METAYLLLTNNTTKPGRNPEPLLTANLFKVAVSEKDEAKRFCRTFKERGRASLPMYDSLTLGEDNIWRSPPIDDGCPGWLDIPNSELTVFDTLDAALAKVG